MNRQKKEQKKQLDHQLDDALESTFPASDPVNVHSTPNKPADNTQARLPASPDSENELTENLVDDDKPKKKSEAV